MKYVGNIVVRGNITEASAGTYESSKLNFTLGANQVVGVEKVSFSHLLSTAGIKLVEITKTEQADYMTPDNPPMFQVVGTATTLTIKQYHKNCCCCESYFNPSLSTSLYIGIVGPGTSVLSLFYEVQLGVYELTQAEMLLLLQTCLGESYLGGGGGGS
jgi:hypothetical protein